MSLRKPSVRRSSRSQQIRGPLAAASRQLSALAETYGRPIQFPALSLEAEQSSGLLFSFARQVPDDLRLDFLRGVFWLLAANGRPSRSTSQAVVGLWQDAMGRLKHFDSHSWLPLKTAQPAVGVPDRQKPGLGDAVERVRRALDLARNLYDATAGAIGGDGHSAAVLPGGSYLAAECLRGVMEDAIEAADCLTDWVGRD